MEALRLKRRLGCFVHDESGQDLIEYALILAVIALGAIAALNSLAAVLSEVPNALMEKFTAAFTS